MIHKYAMNGFNIVIDVNSGAIHEVDSIVFDALNYYRSIEREEAVKLLTAKYARYDIEEAFEEIERLEKDGMLYTDPIDKDVYQRVSHREPVVKALCLHVAHACNLKCTYCFAGEGEYKGTRSLMSAEVGRKAIDFIIQHSGGRRNLEIDFFGGEPTLNFEVVKGIVAYARAQEKLHNKNFRFTLTTNGLLQDVETEKYINENMHNVVLSIDGRKETNDRMRKDSDGHGCYDDIVPKFLRLAESRMQENYYVRGTFTRENLDFYEDVMHLADLGFKHISVEPVVAGKDMGYSLREEDLPGLYEQYDKLAVEILGREKAGQAFNFFHFMIDLTGGPCVAKRITGCGAGTEYLAVTPEGDLYPCHQFVGTEEFKMGSLDDGVTNMELRRDFEGCNVVTKAECGQCWAKYYCSGGCAANGYQFSGRIDNVYEIGCKLQRKRIECAIMIKTAEASFVKDSTERY